LVLGDLAAMGYDARWGVFSAADVGAFHERARLFCVASRDGFLRQPRAWVELQRGQFAHELGDSSTHEADLESAFMAMAQEHARMDDGLAYPVDAVRAIGNGQVPRVARLAWEILTGGTQSEYGKKRKQTATGEES